MDVNFLKKCFPRRECTAYQPADPGPPLARLGALPGRPHPAPPSQPSRVDKVYRYGTGRQAGPISPVRRDRADCNHCRL